MNNEQLETQYFRCLLWNDADQWDALALEYHRRGYTLNAHYCFCKADEIRGAAFAEAMPVEMAEL